MLSRWIPPLVLAITLTSPALATADPAPLEIPMDLGYTIVYVRDVPATVAFYERAFGLQRRFVHDSGSYAEMETGATALAFVSQEQAGAVLPGGFEAIDPSKPPVGMEIALVTPEVPAAFTRAVDAGAVVVLEPTEKPWGQVVAYVRDLDGTLVEIASPMAPPPAEPSAPRQTMTVLAVSDLKRAVDFYRGAFGWPVRIDVPVLVEFELPDGSGLAVYVREGFGRNTNQLPFAVPDGEITGTELYFHCDDLEGTIERLKAAGARELSPLAPRDWGDDAAYFADPDGNVLAVARPSAG